MQLALYVNKAHAQDTTRALKDVVVTASRSPKKLSEIGRVVTVISADEIKRSQGKTLPEVLNTVPGITFSGANNAPGQSSSIFLRGASSGNTLILVDGFPVNDASSIAGNYDLNAFPVDQIDHIEILKGSGSTLYGSDAVAGVINIITKHPQQQGVKVGAQFTGGSYNTFGEAVNLNGKINKTGIALNLSNTDSKGFSAATDTTGRQNFDKDGFHQRSVSANITHEVSSRFTLRGNLQLSRNTGDNDFSAFTDDKDFTYARTFLFAGIGADLKLDKGNLRFNLSQNNVWNGFTNLPSDNSSTYEKDRDLGRITNAEAVFNYSVNRYLDLTSGADFRYNNTIQNSIYSTVGYNPGPSRIVGHTDLGSVFTSLFFKDGIFHMELGGRFNDATKYGNDFTYTVNPSVFLFNRLKLFVTAASAYKAPSLYQLYSEYGNADLKPERTTASYEAGFDLDIIENILSFNTAFYKRTIKDVIYFYTDPVTYKSYYQNGYQQHTKGFESELNLKADKFRGSLYAAYVAGDQTDNQGQVSHNLYRIPKNTYGASVSYLLSKAFSFGLNYKYTGNRIDEDFSTYPANIVTLKHYNLLDAHLQLQATKQLMLFADLKNILDEKYVDWLGYNTRRFNFMAGARYQF